MPRLPSCTARDVVRALHVLGFVLVRQRGSHAFYRHSTTGRSTVVPIHRGEDVDRTLLHQILREIDVTPEVFVRALRGW